MPRTNGFVHWVMLKTGGRVCLKPFFGISVICVLQICSSCDSCHTTQGTLQPSRCDMFSFFFHTGTGIVKSSANLTLFRLEGMGAGGKAFDARANFE